mgnify:CR=1 FL=1
MDDNKRNIMEKRIHKTIENLKANNMQAFYVGKKEDVLPLVSKLIKEGETVAVGGSMSLFECGVIDFLRKGNFNFLDRYKEGLTQDDIKKIYIDSFSADTYLCSSNAVTEKGELYNVDGASNRTAAILYGPKSVIMVVGHNKIVKNIDEAINRVKTIAAPANCVRLKCETFCKNKGECMSYSAKDNNITAGCNTPARICCNYVISAYQRIKDRIKVIIVGEELGY